MATTRIVILALWLRLEISAGTECSSVGGDEACSLLQAPRRVTPALAQQPLAQAFNLSGVPRITIVNGHFQLGSDVVKLLGGNYVMKAQPYYPEIDVVRRNAQRIAESAERMSYRPSSGALVRPCVRLGALFEGAMPNGPGEINVTWAAKLDATVKAFAEAGVYVFLDVHQDALSTTNGGEGLPWWIAAAMQETAGPRESYLVAPKHPMELVVGREVANLLRGLRIPVPRVRTVRGDADPWRAYAVGAAAGDPRFMNVGNLNVRLNNNDKAWSDGVLWLTKQVQALARRFYRSHADWRDRRVAFAPFVAFLLHLSRVWEANSNVVAIELLNEPPVGGLPDLGAATATRTELFDFYAAALRVLDAAGAQAPVCLEDTLGSLPGAGAIMELLAARPVATGLLQSWARRNQLIVSFHFYPGVAVNVGLKQMVALAKKVSAAWGSVPIYLSEFFTSSPHNTAAVLTSAAEFGCDAVTFWHSADATYTGTQGWFWYPESVKRFGLPVDVDGNVNVDAWKAYEQTVADGSFTGAAITGAEGAQALEDVFSHMRPATIEAQDFDPSLWSEARPWSFRMPAA